MAISSFTASPHATPSYSSAVVEVLQSPGASLPDSAELSPASSSISSGVSSSSGLITGVGSGPQRGGSFACRECARSYKRQSDLRKHELYHSRPWGCEELGCDAKFGTQKDLLRHMGTHKKGCGYRCQVIGCPKAASSHVYGRRDNFLRHLRTVHEDIDVDVEMALRSWTVRQS